MGLAEITAHLLLKGAAASKKAVNMLDNKLRIIILGLPDPDGGISEGDMVDGIAQIKQAFADAGYVPIGTQKDKDLAYGIDGKYYHVMTGQEWYDRFVEEYNMWTDSEGVLEAAKRAGGLDA